MSKLLKQMQGLQKFDSFKTYYLLSVYKRDLTKFTQVFFRVFYEKTYILNCYISCQKLLSKK